MMPPRAGRVQLAAAMGPAPVVMGVVLGQDRPQGPLAEGQHPVGHFGPGGEHEPLRECVRPRAAGRDLHGLDAGGGKDRVERVGELPGPVAGREAEVGGAVAEVHQGWRACWVVRGPPGWAVIPRMCTYRLWTSMTDRQYRRC